MGLQLDYQRDHGFAVGRILQVTYGFHMCFDSIWSVSFTSTWLHVLSSSSRRDNMGNGFCSLESPGKIWLRDVLIRAHRLLLVHRDKEKH